MGLFEKLRKSGNPACLICGKTSPQKALGYLYSDQCFDLGYDMNDPRIRGPHYYHYSCYKEALGAHT